jgi:hypothetical protein
MRNPKTIGKGQGEKRKRKREKRKNEMKWRDLVDRVKKEKKGQRKMPLWVEENSHSGSPSKRRKAWLIPPLFKLLDSTIPSPGPDKKEDKDAKRILSGM